MITCVICTAETDGYACTRCATRTAGRLRAIADITPDARAVAHGQTRRGPAVGGSAGGSRLPLNLAAQARLDQVQGALATWARHVAEERGLPQPAGADPLEVAARWLAGHTEWLRWRREVDEVARDVEAAHRVLRGLVDGPAGRHYLGPCWADTDRGRCEGDVYARDDAPTGACRTCGATHDTGVRRPWLDQQVRAGYHLAADIQHAYGVRAGTIRVWAHRGKVVPLLVPLPAGVQGPWEVWRDDLGRPRYPLDAVLRLARRADGGSVDHVGAGGVTSPAGGSTLPKARSSATPGTVLTHG